MVHSKQSVVVCPLTSLLNQVRIAFTHGNRISEENHCCRKAGEIPSLEFGEELVKNQEAEKVKKPWLEDTLSISVAYEGDLAGRALDEAYLEVSLNRPLEEALKGNL